MRKVLTAMLAALLSCTLLSAQDNEFEYLDTLKVSSIFKLNDYWMVGVEYGASFVGQRFVPKFSQERLFVPGYYGVTLTKYSK